MRFTALVTSIAHLLLLKATAQNTTPGSPELVLDYPIVSPPCPDHVPLMFAYENSRCGCFEGPEYAIEDGSPATACRESFGYLILPHLSHS
jgi:hypothetical protein